MGGRGTGGLRREGGKQNSQGGARELGKISKHFPTYVPARLWNLTRFRVVKRPQYSIRAQKGAAVKRLGFPYTFEFSQTRDPQISCFARMISMNFLTKACILATGGTGQRAPYFD